MGEVDFLMYADQRNIANIFEKGFIGLKEVKTSKLTEHIVDIAFAKAISDTFKQFDRDIYREIIDFKPDDTEYRYILVQFAKQMNNENFRQAFLRNFQSQLVQAQESIMQSLDQNILSYSDLNTLSIAQRNKALNQTIEIKYNGLSITANGLEAFNAIKEIQGLSGKYVKTEYINPILIPAIKKADTELQELHA